MSTDGASSGWRRDESGVCLAVVAAGAATLAVSLAFYRLVVRFDEGTIVLAISGWHYAVAVLAWAAVLAVAAVCVVGWLVPTSAVVARALGMAAAALGLLALAAVVVALVRRPTALDLALSAVEHLDADELRQTVVPSMGWSRQSGGVAFGAGLYLLVPATVVAALSGILRWRVASRGGG